MTRWFYWAGAAFVVGRCALDGYPGRNRPLPLIGFGSVAAPEPATGDLAPIAVSGRALTRRRS
jgi:hypothetical protein